MMENDFWYARELQRIRDEAEHLDLTKSEQLALDRAIFLLTNSADGARKIAPAPTG